MLAIRRAASDLGIVAVTTFPAGCNPQVPVSDRRYYPVFQTCVDLDVPIVMIAGIAGTRGSAGIAGIGGGDRGDRGTQSTLGVSGRDAFRPGLL